MYPTSVPRNCLVCRNEKDVERQMKAEKDDRKAIYGLKTTERDCVKICNKRK